LFDANVPLSSRKCSRLGIIWRSEGTLGLSRKKMDVVEGELDNVLHPVAPARQLVAPWSCLGNPDYVLGGRD